MKKVTYNLFGFVLILLVLTSSAGCKQMTDRAEEEPGKESMVDHFAGETSEKTPGNMSESFKGKVVETIVAGRYTYVQVDTGEKMVWVATPACDAAPGEMILVPPGLSMADFQSKTLDRKFEMIYFVGAIRREGEGEGEASPQLQDLSKEDPLMASQAEKQMTHPPMEGIPTTSVIEIGTMEKAEGGQTVSEIIIGRKSLAGKNIRVRAKVVKFTPNIMDKNWLHVRDGSGVEGSNDLIVTTDAVVKIGDVVLIRGIVSVERDFGFGLKYNIIIENAVIIVE